MPLAIEYIDVPNAEQIADSVLFLSRHFNMSMADIDACTLGELHLLRERADAMLEEERRLTEEAQQKAEEQSRNDYRRG